MKNPLKDLLLSNNQTRWLDLGSSSRENDNFYFADIHEPSDLPEQMRGKYFKMDAIKPLSNDDAQAMGQFDLIRMQHVFEHFSVEDGLAVLENCYKLLKPRGYLLISVPDLRIYAKRYFRKSLHRGWTFTSWATSRIPADAPQSFYFSVFTHSVPHQAHLWCYDAPGLSYQIARSGKFSNIERIGLFHHLCNVPFTHNRPLEDLCILAQKQ